MATRSLPISGWLALASAMITQAVKDLCDPDPRVSIDALCFWLDPSPNGAGAWLEMLDLQKNDLDLLIYPIGGSRETKNKTGPKRYYRGTARPHDTNRKSQISG